ncbi:MAG: Asp-tRNA(Asn)/Glu-tRNA(Gln) amidotransferase subunit GatB [Bacteriovoracaceae bacterium]|nr:Asp-tRNA(Asn)/Glu-tRNA(Gln) amidotransferase subunit GatB [Bacteriovoracaceae bacterium]
MNYEVIIGLEIHAQLATKTKAWCSCEISTKAFENTKVCPVCSAQPGALPVLNEKAVEYAISSALALNCKINPHSSFDRKNYFYPDLPKGFQITQFPSPIGTDGYISIKDSNGNEKKVGIERVQMEEDTGKSTHMAGASLINLNRCGTPLIEIVGKPDIRDAKEASEYYKKIQSILVYLGVSHGNMQEGNLRCDVNLSLRKKGDTKFGTRTEVKNLNSFKSVEKAIEHEIQRQAALLDSGKKVEQQTLLFNIDTGTTKVMRTKSNADDYRYFPEPDLLPLIVSEAQIKKLKENLPELPDAKIKRFMQQYSIPYYDADVLTSSKELAQYFETAAGAYKGEAKKASNWIMVELLKLINESGSDIAKSPVPALELANLLNFVLDDTISGKIAKDVMQKMYDERISAAKAIEKMGVKQISDTSALEEMIKKTLTEHAAEVDRYRKGEVKLYGFLVGQTMKNTKGQGNPKLINDILKKLLDG